jgi:L-alanine-DL-glutamate epimerase-like enolase superfamily enzyme
MKIARIELFMVDLKPKEVRSDAIQSFVSQETPIVRITTESGLSGTGYAYTIGTGGSSVTALLRDHLIPRLIGRDAAMVEAIWRDLLFSTHATSVGAITSLALAAVDTALWDLRCKRMSQPLYKVAGGAKDAVDIYSTEGGWLHLGIDELVDNVRADREAGFKGSKIKLGASPATDRKRLFAAREAVGEDYALMTDCNQAFTLSEIRQRAAMLEPAAPAWIEEPLAAHDVSAHRLLCASISTPVAVGESIYSALHFKEYLLNEAADVIQADVARIGGITPWLKVAHMAQCFNKQICPHFLMELHVSLCCAVPNGRWLEYIPQLDLLTTGAIHIENGTALAPQSHDLGIAWDWAAIEKFSLLHETFK